MRSNDMKTALFAIGILAATAALGLFGFSFYASESIYTMFAMGFLAVAIYASEFAGMGEL
jgi:hypothetical protein